MKSKKIVSTLLAFSTIFSLNCTGVFAAQNNNDLLELSKKSWQIDSELAIQMADGTWQEVPQIYEVFPDLDYDYAHLEYEKIRDSKLKDLILKDRVEEVFYGNKSWSVDGMCEIENENGEWVALPKFSEVFPGWDFDVINDKYNEMIGASEVDVTKLNESAISPASISQYWFSGTTYLRNPTSGVNTDPFVSRVSNSSPYIKGYAATLPTGSKVNFGISKNGVNLDHVSQLNVGQKWRIANDPGQLYSVRASTYDNPGEAYVCVYTCTDAND